MAVKNKRRRVLWRLLLCIPFVLYIVGNILLISNVEQRDEALVLALPLIAASTITSTSVDGTVRLPQHTDPSFSREPLLQKGCHLQFSEQSMAFCYAGGMLEQQLGPRIGTRLLEYHYRCSSKDLPVIDISQESRNGRTCLWVELSSANAHQQPGDVTWGSPSTSPANPLLLMAKLFQDYYWLPTANIATRPHFFQGRRCLIDDAEKPVNSCPFGKEHKCQNVQLSTNDVPSFLGELRLCDTVVSNDAIPLILADSLGIPHSATTEEYITNRTTLSESIAEAFPYHLVQASLPQGTTDLKTLVIIMGSIRGGDVTWNSFYKHMLDLNANTDLALVIGEIAPEKRKSSLFERAKYIYEFPEFDDWGDAVDSINGSHWRQFILPQANDKWGTWGGVADKPGSGAVIFMIRWYVSKFLIKENLLEKYDRFVLTRSDHYYGCAHDLSLLDNRYMWIPQGEDYKFGITDRHLVCNRAQILKALDIYPPIVRHPEKYASPHFADFNPEQLLRTRWEQENLWPWIRRFDRVMFTCAVDGDKTRWTEKSALQVREGVFLKYEFEYEETTCVCNTGPCNFPYTRRKMRVGYPQRNQKLV